jgi:hypothetical protein
VQSRVLRLILSLFAGVGAFIATAIAVAIIDLYLSGHSMRQLSSAWIDWYPAGVRMSRADVMCLVSTILVTAITWRATRSPRKNP